MSSQVLREEDLELRRAAICKALAEFQQNKGRLDETYPAARDRNLIACGAAQLIQLVWFAEECGYLSQGEYPEMMEVLAALTDVWQRGSSPLFERARSSEARGNPGLPFNDAVVKDCCIRAIALLQATGDTLVDARKFLEDQLSKSGVGLSNGKSITITQLAGWWDQATGRGADRQLAALVSKQQNQAQAIENGGGARKFVAAQIALVGRYSPKRDTK